MPKKGFYKAELIERINFSDELFSLRFQSEGVFGFQPGQYATIGIQDGDKLIQRPYSIVSAPYEPYLEFFVESVPNGELTPQLTDLQLGDSVLIRQRVVGTFFLDRKSGFNRHLMVATVTGIAPYLSMVRTLHHERKLGKHLNTKMLVIHGASRSSELGIYKDELETMSRDGWLTYIPTINRPWEDPEWNGEKGRVEDVVRKYADQFEYDFSNTVCYVCGHPNMIQKTKDIFKRSSFKPEHIKEEPYFVLRK